MYDPLTDAIFNKLKILKLTGVTGNTTIDIPAGYMILGVTIQETANHAVTGGLRIGTTNGGTDVAIAIATGALALIGVPSATILKSLFNMGAAQTLFIQAVVAWNSASMNMQFVVAKVG